MKTEKDLEFEKLVKLYFDPLYRFIFLCYEIRNDADIQNIIQDTFLAILLNYDKIDEDKNIRGWIFTIAANMTRGLFRKYKSRRLLLFSELNEGRDSEESASEDGNALLLDVTHIDPQPLRQELIEQQKEQQEIIKKLEIAMTKLCPEYRYVLWLRYEQGLKLGQIAKSLNKPLSTVRGRVYTALKTLKKHLKRVDK